VAGMYFFNGNPAPGWSVRQLWQGFKISLFSSASRQEGNRSS
jgi:hypothetical protein